MSEDWQARERMLIGDAGVETLANRSVLLFGVGGVGGGVAEGLARAGIGRLTLVDCDVVAESNLNRQIIALRETIGCPKTEVMAERIRSINPAAEVIPMQLFASPENMASIFDAARPDYVADAIDNVSAKLALIALAKERGIPVISSMGTGNRLDPGRFRIDDISKTRYCPLARVMRRELRVRGITGVDVLWSEEEPLKTGGRTPGSIAFVPPAGGLMIAGHIVRALLKS